jgi:hypothetical protein
MKLNKLLHFISSVPFQVGKVENKQTKQQLIVVRYPKGIYIHDADQPSAKVYAIGDWPIADNHEWKAELRFKNAIGTMVIDLSLLEVVSEAERWAS